MTLHLGDCLGPEGLATLADNSVDHCICDPPYEAEAHSKGRRINTDSSGWGKEWKVNGRATLRTKQIPYPPITEAERFAVAAQIARVTKRWILVFCQAEAGHLWREALEAGGATYKRMGIFWKDDAQPQYSGDRPGVGWEMIVIAHGNPGRTRWNGGGRCGRWSSTRAERAGGLEGQKPLRLMRQLVEDFTDPGDLILDPFAGAGTTLLAAQMLGRKAIGWERLEAHHQIATRRLAGEDLRAPAAQGRLAL